MTRLNWERSWRYFGSREVLKVLVIGNNIDRDTGTFKEVAPNTEGLKNSQEFFVMSVVVELRGSKSAGMESHRVDFTGVGLDGEDCTQSIVGGIGLDNNRLVWNPMCENRGGGKCGLEVFKGFSGGIGEVPFDTFAGEAGERNDDVGVIRDEAAVEIGEA